MKDEDDKIQRMLENIATGKHLLLKKYLDPENHTFQINGHNIGGCIRRQSSWDFLNLVVSAARHNNAKGIVPANFRIRNVTAQAARRELQRELPHKVASIFIKSIYTQGYILLHDVEFPGKAEVPLEFHDPRKLNDLSKSRSKQKTHDE